MKKLILLLIIANFSIFLFAQEKPAYKTYWDNGMKVQSSDGAFKLKFGGRIQTDWASFFEDEGIKDSIGTSINGVEFRRVRFYNSGQIYHNIKYKLQFDFVGGTAKLNDAYIMITKIPVIGFLQIGHFKEPVGFEQLSSSKYLTFMERSLTAADEPARNVGFMIGNSIKSKRLSFRLGIFREADIYGNSKGLEDKYSITTRLYGLPVYKPESKKILHLGTAYSYRNPQGNKYRIKAKPEAHLANNYLVTELIEDASNFQLIQSEIVYVTGPLSIKTEVVHARVRRSDPGNANFNYTAFYGMASYFLTGESKNYKTSGKYSRLKPKNNFDGKGGAGAWEVGLRFSAMDINKENVAGGSIGNITFALNWYLNPATRIITNYIYTNLKGVGNANIVQMRFQIDF
jgi:phosphate-selective porin OprO/OprP